MEGVRKPTEEDSSMPTSTTLVRRFALVTAATVAAATGMSVAPGHAGSPDSCEPIACAADHIGIAPTALTAVIVSESRATNGLGHQRALDLLEEATRDQLAAIAPTMGAEHVGAYWAITQTHTRIRAALIDHASRVVAALRS
jgi:hypothetical protein